jgi:hypothetical protein
VLVDAFPEHPLEATVAEVTPISIPIRGSDVRIYYANVNIKEGFEGLRPGMSAEIVIEVERRHDVTRVPIDAIQWVDGRSFVAVHDRGRQDAGEPPWRWQPIEIGLSDPRFAEVVAGLKAGDRVIANPNGLPAPRPEQVASR